MDFSKKFDKHADTERSIKRMSQLADIASNHGITLCMETLNRFEGYMLNDHNECIKYVKAVNKPNVKVMLDTFHMNIEEDSLTEAIRDSGNLLGHFHIGEANRRCPYPQSRMNWTSIGNALREIGYNEYIVMEPFVRMGGQVGHDVSLWRDLSHGADDNQLDADAAYSVNYIRSIIGP